MPDLRGWTSVSVAAALLATSATATAAPTPAPDRVVRLHDPAITESSGLAVGTALPGVLWTHNDGGSVADVYGVDERTGQTVARVRLRGIDPYDPEALAPGRDAAGRSVLFLGDLGDNSLRRPDVSVFRVAEPSRRAKVLEAPTWWHLTYPDGPHDAEALLVDPRDQRVYVATKDLLGGGLYVAPATLRTDRPNPLRRIGDVPSLVTDGAFLPDGRFVLRTYVDLRVYDRPGHEVARVPLPDQQQGESVAVEPSGRSVLVGSEGRNSPVYRVALPASAVPAASASPGSDASGSATGDAADHRWRWVLSGAALVGAAAAGALALTSRRRRPTR
jgi:hypothetical protein